MLAFLSVWLGVASLGLAAAMLIHPPVANGVTFVLVLYFGSPGALCLAGMVLWAYRKDASNEPGIVAQRRQAKVAIVLAIVAAAIVYLIVFVFNVAGRD